MAADKDQDTQIIDIESSIKRSYLDYSMSVIIGRALPDARDGLKPVHRRILYAMQNDESKSRTELVKSARIVGAVIGRYHPHGDASVYDALVRMAQSFSMRYPIIKGQGNFGSVDGDSAAAMRYTEARMSPLAHELLRDIDKETVDFVPNYDGSESEPDVLPARLPNLLLNGSNGIAVGMATNIPPHSLNELIDGILHLLDHKDASLGELMNFIKGPDFPTGGIIYGKKGIIEAYSTGRGSIKIRAKTHIEQRGGKNIIIVDELPYQTNKSELIIHIAKFVREKEIEGIAEVRDESDREGIRVVIELKRDAYPEIVLNHLFKQTALQKSFSIIMLAIHNKEPRVFGLIELLRLFISHRKTIIIRRTIYELQRAKARAHILEGLQIALDEIDEIIALIKASPDNASARDGLVEKFSLTEAQANAILDMKLGRLTGLEREKIENELKELLALIESLDEILKSEARLEELIKEELGELRVKFDTPRITQIEDDYDEIDVEDLIANENMVVTITHRGYIKRVASKEYERQRRGGKGRLAVTTYEDDFIEDFFTANAHDTLMFVSDRGHLYWLKVYKIPEASRTAKGKALVNLIKLQEGEKIKAIIPTSDFSTSKSLCFFTKNGRVKRTNLSEYKNIRSLGLRAIRLGENDELVTAIIVEADASEPAYKKIEVEYNQAAEVDFKDKLIEETAPLGEEENEEGDELSGEGSEEAAAAGGKMLLAVTKKGMCVKFRLASVRQMGRGAAGVVGIKFKYPGDELIGAVAIEHDEQEVLSVAGQGMGKRTTASEYRLTRRGSKGVICMRLTEKTGELIGVVMVDESMDLMALTSSGKMIRVDMHSIRKCGRNASGVMLLRVENDRVISIAKCPKQENEEGEGEEGAADVSAQGAGTAGDENDED